MAWLRQFTLFQMTVWVCLSTQAQENAKLPIPDEAALSASLKLVEEVYKSEYEAARTPPQKAALAQKLLQDSLTTRERPADRYALLRVSTDIASQAGDILTAFAAISDMDSNFEIDILSLKNKALGKAAKTSTLPAYQQSLAWLMIDLMEDAMRADRFDIANEVGDAAQRVARRTRDGDTVNRVSSMRKRVEEAEAAYAIAKPFRETLEQKPSEPEANFTLGNYLCLHKRDWVKGIPMLALGDDDSLSQLAAKELEETPEALVLADGWWKLSETLEGPTQIALQNRAVHWYQIALPTLDALAKRRVETRLTELLAKPAWHVLHFLDDRWRSKLTTGTVRVEGGRLVLPAGNGILLKTSFTEIGAATIRGKIVPPGKNNFRFHVGAINAILNWEVANENHFRVLAPRPPGATRRLSTTRATVTKPHALAPGRVHEIGIGRSSQDEVVVSIDGKQAFKSKLRLYGTIGINSADHTIAVESIKVYGVLDPFATPKAPSHY